MTERIHQSIDRRHTFTAKEGTPIRDILRKINIYFLNPTEFGRVAQLLSSGMNKINGGDTQEINPGGEILVENAISEILGVTIDRVSLRRDISTVFYSSTANLDSTQVNVTQAAQAALLATGNENSFLANAALLYSQINNPNILLLGPNDLVNAGLVGPRQNASVSMIVLRSGNQNIAELDVLITATQVAQGTLPAPVIGRKNS